MNTDRTYSETFAQEIIELHSFFEDWFSGNCEDSVREFESRLNARMHEDFMIVLPGGAAVAGDLFWPELYRAHGSNPEFRISVRNITSRTLSANGILLVCYEEWQKNARNSKPENNGRLSSALFVEDQQAPNRILWFHVHETWLPDEVVSAADFTW